MYPQMDTQTTPAKITQNKNQHFRKSHTHSTALENIYTSLTVKPNAPPSSQPVWSIHVWLELAPPVSSPYICRRVCMGGRNRTKLPWPEVEPWVSNLACEMGIELRVQQGNSLMPVPMTQFETWSVTECLFEHFRQVDKFTKLPVQPQEPGWSVPTLNCNTRWTINTANMLITSWLTLQ